ncbi:MAG: hypothetical protein IJT66_06100, partial [Clostridia bacterium]|nr:hypothetical protein [Clostridia bacterium]
MDLVNFYPGILETVRKIVKDKNPEIDPLKILANATHTHSAPMVSKDDTLCEFGTYEKLPHEGVELASTGEYFQFLVNSIADAVCESYASRCEGAVSYGYGFATTSHNRRAVYFKDMTDGSDDPTAKFIEGTTKMYGTTAIPEFSGLESGGDP